MDSSRKFVILVNFSGEFIDSQLEKILFHSNVAYLDPSMLSEVEEEEKCSSIAACCWDVDFVSISGELGQVLGDPDVAELLGNSSGKALTICCSQNVRTNTFGRMLMFAKAGDWMIGKCVLF